MATIGNQHLNIIDIAKRLDAQSLAAARLAAQTFVPEPQPDTATSSGAP